MNIEVVSFAILAPISVLSQIILIYGHARIKKMRKHPDVMILWQCISQIILDIHWITGISQLHKDLTPAGCQTLGAFFVYFYFMSWDSILFLSLEILIKITDPFNCNYKKRMLIYHIVSQISGLAIFILLVSVDNNNGNSLIQTCFVQDKSAYNIIIGVPIILHFPICLYVCCYTIWIFKRSRYAKNLLHHVYVVIAFSIGWVPNAFLHGMNYKSFHLENIEVLDDVSYI